MRLVADRGGSRRRPAPALGGLAASPRERGDDAGPRGGESQRRRGSPRARRTALVELPTERKFITLLRADLHNSTDLVFGLEPEDAIARFKPALDAMRAAVRSHGGIVGREMGDGVLAVFGAPRADDRHAVMGCYAGLDLVRRIGSLQDPALRVRVGIHSGFVVAGVAEADYAFAYDVGGPALAVAERLQAAADPGQILASEACRTLAQGHITFGPGQPRSLKGYPEPTVVYPVTGFGETSKWRVAMARGAAPFVGRERETARLDAFADEAESGRGRLVPILGQPGVGKSRLAREFVDRLRRRGWNAIDVECNPIVGQAPFALLGDLLAAASTVAGDRGLDPRSGMSDADRAALGVILANGTDNPVWGALSPRLRARAIVEASCKLVAASVGERPTAILIEDLQWADDASAPAVEAVASLAGRLPLLVLVTARPGELPAWFARLGPAPLPLEPLEAEAGLELLDHLLGSAPRLGALKARILKHSGTLPLFIEEVCRRLAETGALSGADGGSGPAWEPAELGVPATLQGVIASRIDRLAAGAKRILQAAAAIGPRSPRPLLRAVAGVPDPRFEAGLASLDAAALLLSAPPGESGDCAFAHELVRKVAYDAVVGPGRAALHRAILSELEAGAADQGPDSPGALVHHAMMAQEWSRAADHAQAVGRRCLARSALPDAAQYYELAIGAADRLEPSPAREARAIDLRIEARLAYANLGKIARWLELARDAEARARAAGDAKRRVVALAVRAAALNFCGTAAEALEAGREAVREAERTGEQGWLGYAEYGLGQACYVAGRYRDALGIIERAHERFAVAGTAPPPGGTGAQLSLLCCMMKGLCHGALGEAEAAWEAQRAVEAMAAGGDRPYDSVAAGFSRGALSLQDGDAAAAGEALEAALSLARQHGVNLFVPVIACHLGLARMRCGREDEARAALRQAREEAEALEHGPVALRAAIHSALLSPPGADALRGLADLRAMALNARQQGYEALEAEALLAEAELLLATGPGGAPSSAARGEEALSIARRIGAEPLARRAAALLGRAAQARPAQRPGEDDGAARRERPAAADPRRGPGGEAGPKTT